MRYSIRIISKGAHLEVEKEEEAIEMQEKEVEAAMTQKTSNEGCHKRYNICKKSRHIEKDCWFKEKHQCYPSKRWGHLT